MKKFESYLTDIRDVPPLPVAKYFAYKAGKVEIFDNAKSASQFSKFYELASDPVLEAERQQVIAHNKQQQRLAKELFDADLRQECGFNAEQMTACSNFLWECMDTMTDDPDEFAEHIFGIAKLVEDVRKSI